MAKYSLPFMAFRLENTVNVRHKRQSRHTRRHSGHAMLSAPLRVQPHQLVDVEAETDVGDGAAGVGLAGEAANGASE